MAALSPSSSLSPFLRVTRSRLRSSNVLRPLCCSNTHAHTQTPTQTRSKSQVAYEGHVPLNLFEKSFLAVGSAIAALADPYRHDMVAVLGETSGECFTPALRDYMLNDASGEGQYILRNRPRITTSTINVDKLSQLPQGTFGRAYFDWLETNKVTPDTRAPVRFIDDPELAYVMQRYRECHDFYHVITGPFGVTTSAELVVKWFEFANMHLPVAGLSSVFGPLQIGSRTRNNVVNTYLSWALRAGANAKPLITVHWERHWETDIDQLRRQLNIPPPPMTWAEFRKMNRPPQKKQPEEQEQSQSSSQPESHQTQQSTSQSGQN